MHRSRLPLAKKRHQIHPLTLPLRRPPLRCGANTLDDLVTCFAVHSAFRSLLTTYLLMQACCKQFLRGDTFPFDARKDREPPIRKTFSYPQRPAFPVC